jgi:hypothetical protein
MILRKLFLYLPTQNGGLAQLARAFDWQSRGHRFDSDILHLENQRVARFISCDSFFCTQIHTQIIINSNFNGGLQPD